MGGKHKKTTTTDYSRRGLMQPHSNGVTGRQCHTQALVDFASRINVLDGVEPLQQSNEDISRLSEGKLLSDTESRTAVEGEVFPACSAVEPAIWIEDLRILAPEVFSALCHEGAVCNDLTGA